MNKLSNVLEIIAYDIQACQIALSAGADRIELCDNPGDGGTTPSLGMVRKAVEISSVPVFPIIRPRGGDFHYSEEEFEIMLTDIRAFREAGCSGVVVGILNSNGTVDEARTSTLVDAAGHLAVTFHRAFDRVRNPEEALEAVIRCGCRRILTSGCRPTAPEGMDTLRKLHEISSGRIIIMPGSGIRSSNIAEIARYTGCTELHSSAAIQADSTMEFQNPSMRERLTHTIPDAAEIRRMQSQLHTSR